MYLMEALRESNGDVKILWASVFVRMCGYAMTNQVLTLHLKQLGISEQRIGLFMTLTLVGDTLISYYLTWNSDRFGRKKVMLLGCLMMAVSGLVFTFLSQYPILLFAAIIGVISPSGDETGPFKSIEEASIAHLTIGKHRTEAFAYHGLFSTAGAALGSLFVGLWIDYMAEKFSADFCYRSVFFIYSLLAVSKFLMMCFLTKNCELRDSIELESDDHEELVHNETTPLNEAPFNQTPTKKTDSSANLLYRILAVFMLDSFGYGFMPSAWIVYYIRKTFAARATIVGSLFFVTSSVDAFSLLPSVYLTRALGPIKAILFTQAPSAIFLILVPLAAKFWLAAILLILYYSMSTMDVVPRQIVLISIFPKQKLAQVLGLVNIGKTYARCIGPMFTGQFAAIDKLWLGFVLSGGCTLLADIILAVCFLHLDHEISQEIS